jgi:flagellar basal-body rod protein FlgB
MDPSHIALFDLAEQRLAWSERRTEVLAQNIANADTPRWRPRDLKPFAAALLQPGVALAQTSPLHLAPPGGGDPAVTQAPRGEQAPDGNAVSVEAELVKLAETDTGHALVTDLYKKYLGMFRTALGR